MFASPLGPQSAGARPVRARICAVYSCIPRPVFGRAPDEGLHLPNARGSSNLRVSHGHLDLFRVPRGTVCMHHLPRFLSSTRR